MFYSKDLIGKKPKKLRHVISDFSGGINAFTAENLLPQKYAVKAYNYRSDNGQLTQAKGVSRLLLKQGIYTRTLGVAPAAVEKLFYYKRYDPGAGAFDDKLIVYCSDKKLYWTDVDGPSYKFTLIENLTFEMPPVGINYRLNGDDVIILCSSGDGMAVWDGKNSAYTVSTAPHISSMCVHYERLFATADGEKSSVWFSDDLDPTNWDISLEEAGFIEVADDKGSLLKVIQFLDYVYIFRSYGISRLTAYAEQTQFSLIPMYVSSGKIHPDTVSVCGDRIIFLADDGFYTFNGLSTGKIMTNIFPMLKISNKKAVSAYYNGKYYLACKMDYGEADDGFTNNTLLEYDIATSKIALTKGVDIADIKVLSAEGYSTVAIAVRGQHEKQVCGLTSGNNFMGAPLTKVWVTPETDFGYPDRRKLFREIYVDTKTDITVSVTTDSTRRLVSIKGGKGTKRAAINAEGKKLSLSFICSTENCEISRPIVLADLI